MSKDAESLIRWYKEKRSEFRSRTYFKRKNIFNLSTPYSDWDNESILREEISFNTNTLSEIHRKINKSGGKNTIPEIILALKNRAEYISDQAEVYPAIISLIAFMLTTAMIYAKEFLEPAENASSTEINFFIISILLASSTGILININTQTSARRELSYYKELINILEFHEKKSL